MSAIQLVWDYVKRNDLQDLSDPDTINLDKYLQSVFGCETCKCNELPSAIYRLLSPPDPIVLRIPCRINDPNQERAFHIQVEAVGESAAVGNNESSMSTQLQSEITALESSIGDTLDAIEQSRRERDFLLTFADSPERFIHRWLVDESKAERRDENAETSRRRNFPSDSAARYIYHKTIEKRGELERQLESS